MSRLRITVIVLVLLGLLIPATASFAATDLSRFEVVNHSDTPITLWMYEATAYEDPDVDTTQYKQVKNGAFYFLRIGAGERTTFTVDRALYSYTMSVCGETRSGAIDLNNYNRIIVPVCSVFSLTDPEPKSGQELADVTEVAELVKFQITNNTDTTAYVSVTGEGATYNLTLGSGATRDLTVDEGSYSYSYWACDESSDTISFTPYFHTNLELDCP